MKTTLFLDSSLFMLLLKLFDRRRLHQAPLSSPTGEHLLDETSVSSQGTLNAPELNLGDRNHNLFLPFLARLLQLRSEIAKG